MNRKIIVACGFVVVAVVTSLLLRPRSPADAVRDISVDNNVHGVSARPSDTSIATDVANQIRTASSSTTIEMPSSWTGGGPVYANYSHSINLPSGQMTETLESTEDAGAVPESSETMNTKP